MTYPQSASNVELVFEFPAATPSATANLVFGATTNPSGTKYDTAIACRFSLRGSASVSYDLGVYAGVGTTVTVPHQQAAQSGVSTSSGWQTASATDKPCSLPHQQAQERRQLADVVWASPQSASVPSTAVWGAARAAQADADVAVGMLAAATHGTYLPWGWALAANGAAVSVDSTLAAPAHLGLLAMWQWAVAHGLSVSALHRFAGTPTVLPVVLPWQEGALLVGFGGPRYLPAPPNTPQPPQPVVIDLRMCAEYPSGGNTAPVLIFGLNPCNNVTPDSLFYILPARFYMAVHSLEAHLLPGLTQVPIYDVSMAADVDSTVWTFSAKGPMALFDALAPVSGVPARIRITLDGLVFVFLVDKLTSSEAFGQRFANISGRSATALVGQPYARQTSRLSTQAVTAAQLAADALAGSGVGLDWGITDWLVPAGAWSHTGTPLAAVQQIAQAAGGYINSHRSDPTVLVRHPYPTLPGGIPGGPWNWEGAAGAFAADVELAPDALITTSIERQDGPDVDGIYVSGTTQGIQAHVYRQGTAGAKLAPMEVDALITASAAAQQRGYATLGQAGPKHLVQISMPILVGGANPGVLDVGQLVQINHAQPWRGRVRSVSVQATLPKVRQTFTLERHLS